MRIDTAGTAPGAAQPLPRGDDRAGPSAPISVGRPRNGIAHNVLFLALGQIGSTLLAIAFNGVLARTLDARDFGLYFLVTSMATFAYVIVEWGQPMLLVRETARHPQRAGELLGTGLMMRGLGALIVILPLLFFTSCLGFDASIITILSFYFLAQLPVSLVQAFGTVFRGYDRMDRDALVSVLNNALVLILAVVVLRCGGGLAAVALCQLVAGGLSLAVARWFYAGLHTPSLLMTPRTARHLWQGGAAIASFTLVQAVQPYLDVVILSRLAPSDSIAWYGVARMIIGTLLAPAVILATAALPQLSRAASEPAQFGAEVRGALRPMILIGALGAAGTYLFARVPVDIIYGGSHYLPAVAILQVYAPGMFLLFIDVLLGRALFAANLSKAFAVIKVVSVIVNATLDVLLIPWFQAHYGNGGLGVAVAFQLSELGVFAGVIAIMPCGVLRWATLTEAGTAAAAALAAILVISALPGLSPLAGIPLCIAAYFSTAFALGLLRQSDVVLPINLVRGRSAPPERRGAATFSDHCS